MDSTLGTHYEAGALPPGEPVLERSIPLHRGPLALGTLRVHATLEDIHARLWDRVLVILTTQAARRSSSPSSSSSSSSAW